MGVTVSFDPVGFVAQFPEFSACSTTQLEGWFDRATNLWANDGSGPVCNTSQQSNLLNLLTAHIGWMSAPKDSNGNPAAVGPGQPQLVGMPQSVGEGSVNVSFNMGDVTKGSPSQAFYMKTTYGQEFWYATAQFRTARYVARPTRVGGPIYWPGWAATRE
jgi:Protein of unknown function (DUF4054)